MDNFLSKVLDFLSYRQKSLIVISVVVTPVVYSFFYVFMDNFGEYPIFERLMFTGAAITIWIGLCFVLGMFLYLGLGDIVRKDYEFRIKTPKDYDEVFSSLFNSLCLLVFAFLFVVPLVRRIVFNTLTTQLDLFAYITIAAVSMTNVAFSIYLICSFIKWISCKKE